MFIFIAGYISWSGDLLKWVQHYDQLAFLFINNTLSNSFLDKLFPIWRDPSAWFPLYLFLVVFLLINFGKKAWLWLLFFGLTIGLCDQVSSAFIKEMVARPRPCHDPRFSQYVRLLLNYCSSSGSFTSSHAANHFGMAYFAVHTLKDYVGKGKYLIYFWAASICYAQVYIGVHYPLDVIGGALLGCLIAAGCAGFFNRRIGPLTLLNTPGRNSTIAQQHS